VNGPATPPGAADSAALATYVVALGDDALILSQRLSEWIARAPQLEEDIAMANIALDLLGQARALLSYAGEVEGRGRDEDALAYRREERDFRNVQLVEIPGGDFAVTTARQLVFAAYQYELYDRLRGCADATLAAIAAKAVKEVAYHRDHATQWVMRLGDGTPESHRRMQAGLHVVWPYVGELFDPAGIPGTLPDVAVDPAALRAPWDAYVNDVLSTATLTVPDDPPVWGGGRRGVHTEAMGFLLAEMQHLHRSHPGASW
jgi:ring-1,2-phenylacetyl-CoA epoxidase subunit PaaC